MRPFVLSTLIMSSFWMTALLSLGARSCKGFRLSSRSAVPNPMTYFHRREMHDAGDMHSVMGHSSTALQREHPQGLRRNSKSCRLYMSSQSINLITSPKSQTVKKVQTLLSKKKQRLKQGQTVVEGPRMVFDLLDNPKTANLVKQILVSAQDYELRDDYRSKLQKASDNNVLVQLVHPEIFPDCTDTITPQGIVAVVDIPESSMFENKHDNIAPMYLMLDGVSDPGNLGTLLRSSLAVGVAGVILLPDCCDTWNPKSVRSAMGASFQIPILESKSWEEALELLQESGGVQHVYAATMIEEGDEAAPSIPYFNVDWTCGPSALVIGSEGNGLSSIVRHALRTNDKDVGVGATHIPMAAGIESLNAAVCGSVILFEYARQQQSQQD